MEKVRVLLCGMGGYGTNYIREFLTKEIPNATLVAIADPFAQKSMLYEEVIKRGIPLFDSPEAFFEADACDLVVVSSPIHTHYPYIMLALEHGASVLTEKPVCFSEEQMEAMIQKSQECGRFVSVGYQLCFSRDMQKMKRDILSGLYGKPLRMKTLRLMKRNDIYYSRNRWAGMQYIHGEKVLDSPFSNACAHQCQNMLFVLGETMNTSVGVTAVSGAVLRARPIIDNFDTACLHIDTSIGVPLYFYASHSVDEPLVGPMDFYEFSKGTIVREGDCYRGTLQDGSVIEYFPREKEYMMNKLYDSIASLLDHTTPICTLETAKAHTKAVLLCEKLPITDLSYRAEKKVDEKESVYYTFPQFTKTLLSLYESWSVPSDFEKLIFG